MVNIYSAARGQGYLDQQAKQSEIDQKQQINDLYKQKLQFDITDRQKQQYLDQFQNQLVAFQKLSSAAVTPQQKTMVQKFGEHLKEMLGGTQAQQMGVDNYIKQSIDLAVMQPDAMQLGKLKSQIEDNTMTKMDQADLESKKATTEKAKAEATAIQNPFGVDAPPSPTAASPAIGLPSLTMGPPAPGTDSALPADAMGPRNPGMSLPGATGGGSPITSAPNSIIPTPAAPDTWSVNPVNEDFLATLPKREQTILKAVARGDMAYPSGFALNKPAWQKVMSDLPNYDPSANANRKANRLNWDTGKLGMQVKSFNVAVGHLMQLKELSDALQSGDIRAVNSLWANYKTNFGGGAAPTNFDSLKTIVSGEIVKAITGTGGGVEDRANAAAGLNKINSPAALSGTIDEYLNGMVTQLHGSKKMYEDSTGHNDFMKKLLPETRAVMVGSQFQIKSASLKALLHDPSLAPQFDQRYGAGLAREILGK